MAKFTVDTQLFRELGELLVGRESTALVELIKNAYDADARAVVVLGENIDDPVNGQIYIEDNGIGMTLAEFENGFLRIATRVKSEGNRRSPLFNRRYTGEKGIGRLALHKLARHVEIRSYKWDGEKPNGPNLGRVSKGIKAVIDWDLIEKLRTFDDIEESEAIQIQTISPRRTDERQAGTRITLSRLRKTWTDADVTRFHRDVATLLPPPALTTIPPKNVMAQELLIASPTVRDAKVLKQDQFNLELLGDLQFSESFGTGEIAAAHWIIEVDSDATRCVTKYQVAPTKRTLSEWPNAESLRFEVPIAEGEPSISFQARIYQRIGGVELWASHFAGIRIYMEGFRVLPYGEPGDDWLLLGFEYSRRGKGLLPSLGTQFDDIFTGNENEGLVVQTDQAFFGGVFLTHGGAPQLQLLINREGFLPGPALETIRRRVRVGIDMQVRVRYAASSEAKGFRRAERDRQRFASERADIRETPTAQLTVEEIKETEQSFKEARAAIASGNMARASAALEKVQEPWDRFQDFARGMASEASMLRVLASIGTELAAFTHELNGLLEMATGLIHQLEHLRASRGLSQDQRQQLHDILGSAHALRGNLERQASYLIDITSVDARRRRSRQHVVERFSAAKRLVASSADRRGVEIIENIPDDLRTWPMFPAEVTAVFTNLLTNAVKFAGEGGRIQATAIEDDAGLRIIIENTGATVDLKGAEKWFEPFRSSTTEIDATLGQGMGLGLTITRSILDEYGAKIRFIKPSKGFATAIEVSFPTD